MKPIKSAGLSLVFMLLGVFSPSLSAAYFSSATILDADYRLSSFTIPTTAGATTEWADSGVMPYNVVSDGVSGSYVSLSMGGYVLGDGVTWITTNNGIGVQFKLTDVNGCLPELLTPPYRYTLPATTSCLSSSLRVSYRLVRLADFVPAGEIMMPNVQVLFDNHPDSPVANFGPMYYSGFTDQPIVTPCDIDVPSVVRLDDLPGANLQSGTMNMKPVALTFTNCPGAISNIRYQFTSAYGPHDTVYGTINTRPGSAAGIYFQLLRSASEPYQVSTFYDLEGYNGSGNYTVPFNVAYYADSPSLVTLGDVEGQITLVVNYQ